MTYGAMYAIMKKLLPLSGMTKEEAGCHSFRRGTATGLAHINAPSHVIKGIGIWGSDAYLGYIDATESGAMETAMLAMAEADQTGVWGPQGIVRSQNHGDQNTRFGGSFGFVRGVWEGVSVGYVGV